MTCLLVIAAPTTLRRLDWLRACGLPDDFDLESEFELMHAHPYATDLALLGAQSVHGMHRHVILVGQEATRTYRAERLVAGKWHDRVTEVQAHAVDLTRPEKWRWRLATTSWPALPGRLSPLISELVT